MTIERENDPMDELVSRTYRGHSSEKVPDALNQRVLKMAVDDARPSSALSTFFDAWTKPLAWAATVGLSLAIVLEVSQIADGPLSVESPLAESVEDQFKPKNNSQFDDARNQARLRAGPGEDDANLAEIEKEVLAKQLLPENVPLEPKRSTQALPVLSSPDSRSVSRSNFATVTAEPEASAEEVAPDQQAASYFEVAAAKSETVADFAIDTDDPGIQEEANAPNADVADASSARQRQMSARALPSAAIESEKKQSAASAACNETSRETASDWLACIEELRLQGAIEDAQREYDQYELRFPKE